MDSLLLYLLKVSAGTTLFYLLYLLLFRKDTFYLRNRIFLIMTLLLPTVFPAIKIAILSNVAPATPVTAMENIVFSNSTYQTSVPDPVNSLDYNNLFICIYFAIAGILLLRAVISLISTYRIIRKGNVKTGQFPRVIISDALLPPFSFFPYAVIPAKDYECGNYSDILDHEFAHIRQGHTFDLLLSELFIAFQWFNPFVWLIKRSIVLNHEYLADHVSLSHNQSVKEYQYRLLSFQTGLKNISLAHSFNSLIKNRIIMINKKPTRRYATLKNVLILPLVAFVVYAFATPEYRYAAPVNDPQAIYQTTAIVQKEVKGIVLNKEGKPLSGVSVMSSGRLGDAMIVVSGPDGRFIINNIQADAPLLFICRGYKKLSLKPEFNKEMKVIMEIDPEYKASSGTDINAVFTQRQEPLVVVDGIISEKNYNDVRNELGYNMGIVNNLFGKAASEKYGDKGVNGVFEITTRKKALEMGLKPPFPRLAPKDYPTFQNQSYNSFGYWLAGQVKYPSEAQSKKLEGWVSINFTVELDGSISEIVSTMPGNEILSDEVIRVIKASPKWDTPKNPDVDDPFSYSVTLKFLLPDQITADAPFVVVEEMPMYNPGGDKGLLNFISNNTKYPEEAKTAKIQGRVIVRFIVSTEGKAEGVSILKGVHPLLDAEAVRVVSSITGFKPGMQGGKPVDVWYMVPVIFSLSSPEKLFTESSELELLKFLAANTGYPLEAKNSSDTGSVYVVVKMNKGGVIKECSAFTERDEIKVPILPKIVIVGYKSAAVLSNSAISKEHPLLKTECLRMANKLTEVNIPEWKEKDIEFALAIKFTLK